MAGRPKGLVKTGGRERGTPNRKSAEIKEATAEFFARIVDDETEAKFWRYFMTGYQVAAREDGTQEIIPIPLNPVAFQAFKRAVEYKRGMPVQPVEGKGQTVGIIFDVPRPERNGHDREGIHNLQ